MPVVQDVRPVPILSISKEKVSINTDALRSILEKVGIHPFAFISINGPKRTGKSFMLSNFIRYLNANPLTRDQNNDWIINSVNRHQSTFEWRGGSERNTRGIDVWSEPFWIQQNGRRVAILLMDTQGSFDDQTTLEQNAVIFAISTLLSSVLIFNIMRDITEDLLQFFQFFSSYATLSLSGDNADSPGGAFQNLIFLLRDFQFVTDYELGFYDDNTRPPGQCRNYKTEVINPQPGQPEEVRFTHDQVTKSFQNIGVYLMPEPGKELKQRDQVDNMGDEFVHHLEKVVKLILSRNIATKKIGGVEVTGKDMIRYVDSWASLFENHGVDGMPEIKSIYHSVADQQYIMAKQTALSYYVAGMHAYLKNSPNGIPEAELDQKHLDLVSAATSIYKRRRNLGGKAYDRKFDEDFPEETGRLFETFRLTNHANYKADQVKAEMEETIGKISAEIRQTEADMAAVLTYHEVQQMEMREEIENGQRKASDLEMLLENQREETENFKKELAEKEAKMVDLRVQREEQENAGPNPVFQIMETVGRLLVPMIPSLVHSFMGPRV